MTKPLSLLVKRRMEAARRHKVNVQELVGLCKGVLADGMVNQGEAQFLMEFLADWLVEHEALYDTWPANMLYERIREMLLDGVLDAEEQAQLTRLLKAIADEDILKTSQTLPLTYPIPPISFDGIEFMFIGEFASGTESQCIASVHALGGRVEVRLSKNTQFCVIGAYVGPHWQRSLWAKRIEEASAAANSSHLAIISEQAWAQAIDNAYRGESDH